MVDPTVVTANSSLAKILTAVALKLEAGQGKEIQSLKAFADFKFLQIERVHRFFLDLLIKLHKAAATSKDQLDTSGNLRKAWKTLLKETDYVKWTREGTSEDRREQYEEARVYAENSIEEQGVLKKLPDKVARDLQAFMSVYCSYFQTENVYSHELKRTIVATSKVLDGFRERVRRFRKHDDAARADFESILSDFMTGFEDSRERLRASWADVAAAYHQLNLTFREHGLVDANKRLPHRSPTGERP